MKTVDWFFNESHPIINWLIYICIMFVIYHLGMIFADLVSEHTPPYLFSYWMRNYPLKAKLMIALPIPILFGTMLSVKTVISRKYLKS